MEQKRWTPEERAEYLADQLARERRQELVSPPLTGDTLADIGAADRAFEVVDAEWERLDDDFRQAQGALAMYPSREAAAEVVELRRLRDAAWSDRQAALRRRDGLAALMDGVFDEAHDTFHRERGWGLD